MKSLKLLLFPLFVFAVASPIGTTAAGRDMPELIRLPTSDDSILDIDGNKVEVGTRYYMGAPALGTMGRVALGWLNTLDECPSDIIRTPGTASLGDPVEFIPENESDTFITTSKNILIKFNNVSNPLCVDHQAWTVVQLNPWFRSSVLKAGHMSDATRTFRLEPIDYWPFSATYKLTYCQVNGQCYNVGNLVDRKSNVVRLALNDEYPLVVFLKKVED